MTAEALRQYILGLGASQSILQLEWDALWATNKKVIDPIAPRYYAVEKQDSVPVKITGGPAKAEMKEMPRHKKNPAVGTKKTAYASEITIDQQDASTLAIDEEITLMDWGNAIVREINKADNGVVQNIVMELHLAGDFKKTEKKITWLASSADAPKLISASLVDFDYLLTKKKIEENDDWQQYVTPVTEFRKDALVDSNCAVLKPGEVVQFERKGYYILDSVEQGSSALSDGSGADAGGSGISKMVFFLIPDGKIGTVASKADKSVPAPSAAPNTGAAAANVGHKTGYGKSGETENAAQAIAMYSVKPIYGTEEAADVDGINMYKVKPVY